MVSTKACIPSSADENVVCTKNSFEAADGIASNRIVRIANGNLLK
jgi:hypothetical protein